MRLQSIRLAGFKSFAEPTSLQLPGQLVGVVGPNGCGKSNIMDAVRWVLGESRASELRGESMQDVIFNGTTGRKPAQRASVELVFDNADHRAGGQWNQYAEIAVKRVLTRDGTSSYYLNSQPVRRRDVQDVFLGTGLGPRAYAIIGQGAISRIIESRPEELRLFLEEAAGVSKYKERRRETENRLSDTRENLTRVEDILRELSGNLEKLERQAEVAQRYTALQNDLTRAQQLWWLHKSLQCEAEQQRASEAVRAAQVQLEARSADLHHAGTELEQLRQTHYQAGEQVNQAQGLLYEAAAEVGKLEAEIRYVLESRQRTEQRLRTLHEQAAQWQQRVEQAHAEALTLQQQLAQTATRWQEQDQALAQHNQGLPALQQAVQDVRARADVQRLAVAEIQQQLRVLAAEQRGLDERQRQLEQRQTRLQQEQAGIQMPESAELERQRSAVSTAETAARDAEAQLHDAQERLPLRETERRQAQAQSNQESARHSELVARLQALKALQERVKTDGKLRPWLQKHGMQDLAALWSQVQVEHGWENALEAVLRERLGALAVSRLEMVEAFARDVPPAKLSFYGPAVPIRDGGAGAPLPRLIDKLRCGDAGLMALLSEWLYGCYTASSLQEALQNREQLTPGACLVVASGHSVGRHSVSFYAADSEQAGLLARAHEIDNLEREVRAQSLLAEQAREAVQRAEAAYAQDTQRLAELRRTTLATQQQQHAAQVQWLRLSQLAEQAQSRSTQLERDLAEVQTQLQELAQRSADGLQRFESLDAGLGVQQEAQAEQDDAVRAAEAALQTAREQQRQLERTVQELAFEQRNLQGRLQQVQQSGEAARQQVEQTSDEAGRAQAELSQLSDVAAQGGLQSALVLKTEREQTLGQRRSVYDDLTARLRACDEQRQRIERELDPLRHRITELQLKEQAAQLGLEQYRQHLEEAQVDRAALLVDLQQPGIKPDALPAEVDRLHRAIAALGAVNLAALDELGSARERQQFLDAQSADLREAMGTLEAAIRQIDSETRALLGDTFNAVNGHFGRMFPELFGGGQARLVMTGEEVLDSGVQVFAQPPGKKNQTIQLLSGGEKALTAIALVFAIFQLNPAPFCLLDEVDAPLDEANTERYAKLVAGMSKVTQFLFISHNKIAMEMAQQLIGVTMQEQGVSRVVAVDMESALALAQTA